MKYTCTLLSMICFAFSLNAQQHLHFLDVPIDGPLDRVVHELTIRGLSPGENLDKNIAVLHGDKNGQPIDFLVVASEDGQRVFRIVVMTQPKYQWRWLRNEYRTYKKALTRQYGEPNAVEVFMAPYNKRKSLRRHQLQAILEGRGQWVAFYTVRDNDEREVGSIMLQMAPNLHLARNIIVYDDAANSSRFSPAANDTLLVTETAWLVTEGGGNPSAPGLSDIPMDSVLGGSPLRREVEFF